MQTTHPANAPEQRRAERYMLEKLRFPCQPEQPTLNCDAKIKLDGFDEKRRRLCEVYGHIGSLKPGQRHKVASDILKMLLVENSLGGRWHKIYCFVNEVPKELSGNSWLKHAAKQFHVQFEAVQLPQATVALLKKAQHRQAKSINPRTLR